MDYKNIESIISGKDKIFISSHINPDGDSLGSAFAVYHYLKALGKDCRIINHSSLPDMYGFLNNDNIFCELDDDSAGFIKNADFAEMLTHGLLNTRPDMSPCENRLLYLPRITYTKYPRHHLAILIEDV